MIGHQDRQHRAAERDYWRRSLREQRNLNRITLVAALVAAFAGLAGFWVLRGTLKTATGQAQTAQQEFELSERPWVYLENMAITKPLTPNAAGVSIALRFSLTNIGHSPAFRTAVALEAFNWPPNSVGIPDISPQQKKVCDDIEHRHHEWLGSVRPGLISQIAGNPAQLGYTLFPGQQKVFEKTTYSPSAPIPIVVGCVDYSFAFESGHHQTPFVFIIWRLYPNSNSPELGFPLGFGQTIPLADLKIEESESSIDAN